MHDVESLYELICDIGDEHSGCCWLLLQSQFYKSLLPNGEGLPDVDCRVHHVGGHLSDSSEVMFSLVMVMNALVLMVTRYVFSPTSPMAYRLAWPCFFDMLGA
jgi:hypothetical protein